MIKSLKLALGHRLLKVALNLLEVPDGTQWNIAQAIELRTKTVKAWSPETQEPFFEQVAASDPREEIPKWWKQ